MSVNVDEVSLHARIPQKCHDGVFRDAREFESSVLAILCSGMTDGFQDLSSYKRFVKYASAKERTKLRHRERAEKYWERPLEESESKES